MSKQFLRRVLFLVRRRRFERELDEEVSLHLHRKVQERIASGLTPEEARRTALRDFGNRALHREDSRSVWAFVLVEQLIQDVRYGLRMLLRNPGFTSVAVLSLALGIGANTAIFSLIDAVLLRSLPVREPGRLVQLRFVTPGQTPNEARMQMSFRYPVFERLRIRSRVFSGVFAVADGPQVVELDGRSERARGMYASADFFATLGVPALLGRALGPQDDRESAETPAAVLTHGYWKRRFALDPSVLGKSILVEGVPLTIVGVLPAGFSGVDAGANPDLYIPVALETRTRRGWSGLKTPHAHWLWVMARLAPGVSLEQARATLAVLSPSIMAEAVAPISKGEDRERFLASRIDLDPAPGGLARASAQHGETLVILMATVGTVLLIACVNVANLLLARSGARQREIAVRLAIGAGRGRIGRQFLTESALLSVLGGAAGLVVSAWGTPALAALLSSDLVFDLRTDSRVLAFAFAVSIATGLLFGLAPALRATRQDVGSAMKKQLGPRQRLGKGLVVAQVALSLVVLAGAGLFLATLRNLLDLDAGFDRGSILLVGVDASRSAKKGAALGRLYEEAVERVRALPGVRAASVSWAPPVTKSWGSDGEFTVDSYAPAPGEKLVAYTNWVGPGFFATIGTRVLAGREYAPGDAAGRKVVIINETMARRFWPEGAVGRYVRLGRDNDPHEIVGVVGDVKYMTLRERTPPVVYLPFRGDARASLAIRSGDPSSAALAAAARRELESMDANILLGTRTLAEQVERSLERERLLAALSGLLGALALALAAIGLYGVMAYAVARRTREIGVRMALGARPGDVARGVLRDSLVLVSLGAAIGAPLALAATRSVKAHLFGTTPGDPAIFTAAAALLVVALAAGYLPARRAARLDPMEALRHE